MKPDKVGSDLQTHFHNRLQQLMQDTAETCELGGMRPESIGAMLLSVLFYEMTLAVQTMGTSKLDFIKMCMMAYDQMTKTMEKLK